MKKPLILAALSLLATTQAFAGAANADLDCRSARTGVRIAGSIPGDFAEMDVTVSQGGKSSHLFAGGYDENTHEERANVKYAVVESQADGVWTFSAETNNGYGMVKLYAVPKTYKFKRIPNGYHARFTAKGFLNLEELGGQGIETSYDCTLHYEI